MKPRRSKPYMEWIHTHDCVVTRQTGQVVAHHVTVRADRGLSQKPSDLWCLPLDWYTHDQLHHVGEKAFWEHHRMDPHRLIAQFLNVYKNGADPDANAELQDLVDRGLI